MLKKLSGIVLSAMLVFTPALAYAQEPVDAVDEQAEANLDAPEAVTANEQLEEVAEEAAVETEETVSAQEQQVEDEAVETEENEAAVANEAADDERADESKASEEANKDDADEQAEKGPEEDYNNDGVNDEAVEEKDRDEANDDVDSDQELDLTKVSASVKSESLVYDFYQGIYRLTVNVEVNNQSDQELNNKWISFALPNGVALDTSG